MRIFSNFDTNLCETQYARACDEYGQDKTLFVRRDRIYLYVKVYPVLFRGVIALVLCVLLGYYSQIGLGVRAGWIVGLGIFFPFLFISIRKWIDRWMDYTIITPRQVIQYDQSGILDRATRTLDLAKIKSINIQKKGLMTSVFDLGSLVFFSEGDDLNGDIKLNYIKNPIALKAKITKIMHESVSANQSFAQEAGI